MCSPQRVSAGNALRARVGTPGGWRICIITCSITTRYRWRLNDSHRVPPAPAHTHAHAAHRHPRLVDQRSGRRPAAGGRRQPGRLRADLASRRHRAAAAVGKRARGADSRARAVASAARRLAGAPRAAVEARRDHPRRRFAGRAGLAADQCLGGAVAAAGRAVATHRARDTAAGGGPGGVGRTASGGADGGRGGGHQGVSQEPGCAHLPGRDGARHRAGPVQRHLRRVERAPHAGVLGRLSPKPRGRRDP